MNATEANKNRKIGDKITFNLDHSPHAMGEGIIVRFDDDYCIVKITKDCQEYGLKFECGRDIVVFFDEITSK